MVDNEDGKKDKQERGFIFLHVPNAPAFESEVDLEFYFYNSNGEPVIGHDYDSDGSDETTHLSLSVAVLTGDIYILVYGRSDNDWDYEQPYKLTVSTP